MAGPAILPLASDQSSRFLPWIVAVMVFLGGLAAASAILANRSVAVWDSRLSGRVTVQIPPSATPADELAPVGSLRDPEAPAPEDLVLEDLAPEELAPEDLALEELARAERPGLAGGDARPLARPAGPVDAPPTAATEEEATEEAATEETATEESATEEALVADVMAVIRARPEVIAASRLGEGAISDLLEPWIGALPDDVRLPLPVLIDVQVAPGSAFDGADLQAALVPLAPGVSVDDHRIWLAGLVRLASTFRAVAILIVLIVGLSAVTSVVFATRSSLAIHAPTVELLHLIGAPDIYIARLFQRHALVLGLRGAVPGALASLAVLFLVSYLARDVRAGLLPPVSFGPADVLLLVAVPGTALLLVAGTARLTAVRALARLA